MFEGINYNVLVICGYLFLHVIQYCNLETVLKGLDSTNEVCFTQYKLAYLLLLDCHSKDQPRGNPIMVTNNIHYFVRMDVSVGIEMTSDDSMTFLFIAAVLDLHGEWEFPHSSTFFDSVGECVWF